MRLKLTIFIVSIFFFTLPEFSRKISKNFFFPSVQASEKKGIPGKWKHWRDFANEHFRYPLPPMGEAPKSYEGAERSLLPESCGGCHPEQYEQWKTTLHAKSMSPGVYGQLVDMWRADPEQAQSCNECHAPLAEQQKRTKFSAGPLANWRKNPVHDRKPGNARAGLRGMPRARLACVWSAKERDSRGCERHDEKWSARRCGTHACFQPL